EIRASIRDRIEETRYLLGSVLVVPRHDHGDVVRLLEAVPIAGSYRSPDSQRPAELDDGGAELPCDQRGAISRPIVDHDYLVDDLERGTTDDVADLLLFVEHGRDCHE